MKLENSSKFNFKIWTKMDEFHLEVENVSLTKMVCHFQLKSCYLMLVEKLTHVGRLRLCCGFNSTLSTILVRSLCFELGFLHVSIF
jgi:hypothetical protein